MSSAANGFPTLTKEQEEICATCIPPTTADDAKGGHGRLFRVTAAAGSGKTTVLLQLAMKAIEQGHEHITYVTFSKAAAKDGKARLIQTLQQESTEKKRRVRIDGMTLHACAQYALKTHYQNIIDQYDDEDDEKNENQNNDGKGRRQSRFALSPERLRQMENARKVKEAKAFLNNTIKSDKQVLEWIAEECKNDIDIFMRECYETIDQTTESKDPTKLPQKIHLRKQRARRKVLEFILKTLEKQFCNRKISFTDFQGPKGFFKTQICKQKMDQKSNDQRIYYLCKKFHIDRMERIKEEGVDPASVEVAHPNQLDEEGERFDDEADEDIANDKKVDISDKVPVPSEQAERLGFTHHKYLGDKIPKWYADQACKIWEKSLLLGVRSFSFEMKRAQLLKLEIPGSILLVDEAQDMDECQVSWVAQQQVEKYKKLVYIVGDAAQSIYGFRGAKSEYFMDLDPNRDLSLTASWRFGNEIAAIANTVLFAKTKSAQSKPKYDRVVNKWKDKYWIPYRVTSGRPDACPGHITNEPLLPKWRSVGEMTLIARTNASLLKAIVDQFLKKDFLKDEQPNEGDNCAENPAKRPLKSDFREVVSPYVDNTDGDDSYEVEEPGKDQDDAEEQGNSDGMETKDYPSSLPKIHINSGATAGRASFARAFRQIEKLFALYTDKTKERILPKTLFPEFEGVPVSWSSFVEDCIDYEYSTYFDAIGIIRTYHEDTLEVVEKFRMYVLEPQFKADEADIILSTAHSSKGLEWENVQLCNDFETLSRYNQKGCKYEKDGDRFKRIEQKEKIWQFSASEYGCGINLLYVAATRSKRLLSVPTAIREVLHDFDSINGWILAHERMVVSPDLMGPCAGSQRLELKEVPKFFAHLVEPFRQEQGLDRDQKASELIRSSIVPTRVVTPPRGPISPHQIEHERLRRKRLFDELAKIKTPRKQKKLNDSIVMAEDKGRSKQDANPMSQGIATRTVQRRLSFGTADGTGIGQDLPTENDVDKKVGPTSPKAVTDVAHVHSKTVMKQSGISQYFQPKGVKRDLEKMSFGVPQEQKDQKLKPQSSPSSTKKRANSKQRAHSRKPSPSPHPMGSITKFCKKKEEVPKKT